MDFSKHKSATDQNSQGSLLCITYKWMRQPAEQCYAIAGGGHHK